MANKRNKKRNKGRKSSVFNKVLDDLFHTPLSVDDVIRMASNSATEAAEAMAENITTAIHAKYPYVEKALLRFAIVHTLAQCGIEKTCYSIGPTADESEANFRRMRDCFINDIDTLLKKNQINCTHIRADEFPLNSDN